MNVLVDCCRAWMCTYYRKHVLLVLCIKTTYIYIYIYATLCQTDQCQQEKLGRSIGNNSFLSQEYINIPTNINAQSCSMVLQMCRARPTCSAHQAGKCFASHTVSSQKACFALNPDIQYTIHFELFCAA